MYITHRFGRVGRRFCIEKLHAALARYRPGHWKGSVPSGPRLPYRSESQASNPPALAKRDRRPQGAVSRGVGVRLGPQRQPCRLRRPAGCFQVPPGCRLLWPIAAGIGSLRTAFVAYIPTCGCASPLQRTGSRSGNSYICGEHIHMPQFNDSKDLLGFESIPNHAPRSCWLCGLSAQVAWKSPFQLITTI